MTLGYISWDRFFFWDLGFGILGWDLGYGIAILGSGIIFCGLGFCSPGISFLGFCWDFN